MASDKNIEMKYDIHDLFQEHNKPRASPHGERIEAWWSLRKEIDQVKCSEIINLKILLILLILQINNLLLHIQWWEPDWRNSRNKMQQKESYITVFLYREVIMFSIALKCCFLRHFLGKFFCQSIKLDHGYDCLHFCSFLNFSSFYFLSLPLSPSLFRFASKIA